MPLKYSKITFDRLSCLSFTLATHVLWACQCTEPRDKLCLGPFQLLRKTLFIRLEKGTDRGIYRLGIMIIQRTGELPFRSRLSLFMGISLYMGIVPINRDTIGAKLAYFVDFSSTSPVVGKARGHAP